MLESAVKRAECIVGGIGVMRKKKPVLERTRAISPSPRPISPCGSGAVLSAPANPTLRKQSSSKGSGGSSSRENSKEDEVGKKSAKPRPDCDSLWRYFKDQRKESRRFGGVVPSIEVTPSRRVSISSPLRFTRTCSQDSLESLERVCRKELRRKLLERPQALPRLPWTSPGRPLFLKRSVGDVRDPPSPTKKTLSEIIGLTAYQQKLLIQCWPNIYSTGPGGQFASAIYNRLQNSCPKAKQLLAKANGVAVFANSDVDCTAMHSRVTIELLDTAIRNLDADHAKLTAYLIEVGRSHRPLRQEGLAIAVWDDLADSLMECVCRYDAVKKHKELRRAWLALIAYIVDNLKNGQSIFRSSSSYEIADSGSPVGSLKK
ncbi:glb-24 [Pristionchus pacificus]|uniref:Glb-24 n=1 Tax=Pristionchus pacificus TaxID=54126 RepID=A0A2A6CS38_PRIPA|nr:glb-24 [Pristionchus pacificus]|eukprot:PDM80959.1 glb-24 [Pristionchus pacificus]